MRKDLKSNRGLIYLLTNKINNKNYIGKTTVSLNLRIQQHVQASKRRNTNSILHKAILKYGIENFNICILCEDVLENLNNKEIYYIGIYNSITPNGYNLTKGGDGGIWTEERKKQFSIIQKIRGNTPEEKLRRSERNKERYKNPEQRKITSEASKDRKFVTNGIKNKNIKEDKIDTFLKENSDWYIGKTLKINTKGRITIHKDNVNKFINKEELDKYLNLGWNIGGKKLNIKKSIWIFKDSFCKKVNEEELEDYIKKGFCKGRNFKSNKNKIRIVNIETNEELCINKEDYNLYDKLVWFQGRKKGFTPWNENRSHLLTEEHKKNISKGMKNVN